MSTNIEWTDETWKCGAESEVLDTIEQRRAWHRQHKGDKLDDFVARGCDDRGREVHL
jgi:hypothetical protein